jgi:MFS transporter, DHA1 family, multidrug resistance protein
VGILGIMATNLFNVRFVVSVGSPRILLIGAAGAAVSGLLAGVAAWTDAGGLFGLAIPLFAFVSFSGLIVANSIAGAMKSFSERAGAVSALVGAMHYGTGILGSALVGIFADGTPLPMAWTIAVCGIGSAFCAWLAARPPQQHNAH